MQLVSFVLGSLLLSIQQYADFYKELDLRSTLVELENDLSLPRIQTYDFIVAGAGSAGCIVASRLSEQFTVLLLEGGGNPPPTTYTPYFLPDVVTFAPSIHYTYQSTRQQHFSLNTGGIFEITSGKMLGGSGSHNENVYTRGSPLDWDNYALLTRDASWSYRNMLNYFKKMENFVGRLVNESERHLFYGSTGPLTVTTSDTPSRILPYWLEAGNELGFKVMDGNAHQQSESFTPTMVSSQRGEKDDAYISYIKPIEGKRKSLTVLRYSDVEEVLLNDDKRAYGVTFKRHGIPQIAHASKEVIISAGAINTPILLIKSGIGSRSVLNEAQIPVKVESPGVGQNLRGHCGVSLFFTFNLQNHNITNQIVPKITDSNVEEELIKFQTPSVTGRKGIFSYSLNTGEANYVSSVRKAVGENNWPDIQIRVVEIPYYTHADKYGLGHDFKLGISLNRQQSSGTIGFNSSAYRSGVRNPTELALVDHRFYTEKDDVTAMIDGINLTFKIIENTKVFQSLQVEYVDIIPEACKRFKFRSESYWRCFIEYNSEYRRHAVGTAKMGQPGDPSAVLDSSLRVRGSKCLRVIDASIFPVTTDANINSPTMVIAEKSAAEILYEYRQR